MTTLRPVLNGQIGSLQVSRWPVYIRLNTVKSKVQTLTAYQCIGSVEFNPDLTHPVLTDQHRHTLAVVPIDAAATFCFHLAFPPHYDISSSPNNQPKAALNSIWLCFCCSHRAVGLDSQPKVFLEGGSEFLPLLGSSLAAPPWKGPAPTHFGFSVRLNIHPNANKYFHMAYSMYSLVFIITKLGFVKWQPLCF